MSYLLDTHTLLWFITNDPRLPKPLCDEIRNIQIICIVSVVSLCEIGIKYSLKKLHLKKELSDMFSIIHDSHINAPPISTTHILQAGSLPFHHRYPFDRLLIAQAQVEGLTILTRDSSFGFYDVNTKWN